METQKNSALNLSRSWWKKPRKLAKITFLLLVALSLISVGIVNSENLGRSWRLFAALNYSSETRLTSHGRSSIQDAPQRSTTTSGVLDTSTPKRLPAATPTSRPDKTLSYSDWEPTAQGSPLWQRLDSESDVFLYSAHYDDIETPDVIRLVGLARYPLPYSDVWCRFFDGEGRVVASNVSGTLYHFRGRNGRQYLGAFVDCPVTNDTRSPYSLAVGKHRAPLQTFHTVHYSQDPNSRASLNATSDTQKKISASSNGGGPEDSAFRWNITRCFPAFFGRSVRHYESVAEMVAASRALGVDHFQFYVESASPQLLKLLKVLTEDGLAEVLPWNLHMSGGQVHYLGQFSAIQDCLYRHLHSSRYLLFGDVDELFVPRTHDTLLPLLDQLFSKNPQCGAFLFRNTFFNFLFSTKMPPTDPQSVKFIHQHDFPILTHVTRNKAVHNPEDRSKPAVDPRKVAVGSVHIVHKLRQGYKQCTADPSQGLLHHYRPFTYGNAQKDKDTIEDPYIWRLTDTIVKETQKLLTKINVTLPVL